MTISWRGVSYRADTNDILAGVNNHYGTGAVLSPFNVTFLILVAPEIRVLDYLGGPKWNRVGQSVRLAIKLGGFGWCFGLFE